MAVTIDGTTGIDKVQDGSIVYADLDSNIPLGTKNLIINGNMQIAQRGTSVSGITTSANQYNTCDRWTIRGDVAGTWTQTQDTDVPAGQGFANSLKMQCTTAEASPAAGEETLLAQFIEGQNLQQLKKGTANAESVTLSFWVKSNKTGTYIIQIEDADNNRSISQSYTISSADTWEKKILTFAGDTTGTFDNDNNASIKMWIFLQAGTDYTSGTLQTSWGSMVQANRAVGQVNLADTVNNYINITGVQLEVGDTATPFEHRMYSQELALCQRYFEVSYSGSAAFDIVAVQRTASNYRQWWDFKVEKRTSPTIALGSGATWGTSTPSITVSATRSQFQSSSLFNINATANTISLSANAEL